MSPINDESFIQCISGVMMKLYALDLVYVCNKSMYSFLRFSMVPSKQLSHFLESVLVRLTSYFSSFKGQHSITSRLCGETAAVTRELRLFIVVKPDLLLWGWKDESLIK